MQTDDRISVHPKCSLLCDSVCDAVRLVFVILYCCDILCAGRFFFCFFFIVICQHFSRDVLIFNSLAQFVPKTLILGMINSVSQLKVSSVFLKIPVLFDDLSGMRK